ncbi:helix-turn-helix domain-containing protein [Aquabacter sp. P-9]|uniref:helix-turn-helix domain-containing protein n=1 Tax=Aquabacter sediminis TaxID=3029197 RepID=UPI00237DD17D|nr:cupin domain-containing protein [Aquabacter sp. P-9]MDE1570707.1 cupin domain-containing protein [Aquabacter sp. P-9]
MAGRSSKGTAQGSTPRDETAHGRAAPAPEASPSAEATAKAPPRRGRSAKAGVAPPEPLPEAAPDAPEMRVAKAAPRGGAKRKAEAEPAPSAADLTADDVHAEADARVGAVVRAERLRRGWSLGALAEQAMISIGMLSQIERGLATPSLRTLRLLAGALDVPITQFFEGDSVPPSANPFIVRAHERHCLNLTNTGINKMFLMPPGTSLLEMWEFRFAPGGTSGGALYNHNGEKAGVVIQGRIKLLIGDETYTLEAGDSFRFSSMLRHRVDNDSDEEARVFWVVTPPASGGRAPSRQ